MHIIVIDDHDLVLDLLTTFVARRWPDAVVEPASTLQDGLARIDAAESLDLILLDLRLGGTNAIDVLPQICRRRPDTPVAVITGDVDATTANACIAAGARGFLPKTLTSKALVGALEVVLSGQIFFPWELRGEGEPQPAPRASGAAPTDDLALTPRERDVLQHLCEGKANKEIARALGISEVTVKLHMRGVFRKLDAGNRTQALRRAFALGLVA